jgi:hypothetical protein
MNSSPPVVRHAELRNRGEDSPRLPTLHQQIAPDVKLGQNVRIFGFTNLYGCDIGDDTKIGTFVEIQKNARIGRRCKISSHTFICEGVTIEDEVFVGHNVTFINDRFPRATNGNGTLQSEADWQCVPTSSNAAPRSAPAPPCSAASRRRKRDHRRRQRRHQRRPPAHHGSRQPSAKSAELRSKKEEGRRR